MDQFLIPGGSPEEALIWTTLTVMRSKSKELSYYNSKCNFNNAKCIYWCILISAMVIIEFIKYLKLERKKHKLEKKLIEF